MPTEFQILSLTHVLTLLGCAAVVTGSILFARQRGTRGRETLRHFVGWGCIAVWILNTAYWMMPGQFDLSGSLPLHFCNVANLFAALALLRKMRLFQGVIYFWAGLYVWAFLTPTVGVGPALGGFWIFWIYHLFIALAFAYLVAVAGFRPTFRDLLHVSAFTLAYVGFLAGLDAVTGWNYGFLGDTVPNSPTPVDVLGPYPWRIGWMILIGAAVFTVMWLPCARRPSRRFARRLSLPED